MHEDNEWCITCDANESVEVAEPTIDFGDEAPAAGGVILGAGVEVAFERSHELKEVVAEEEFVKPEGDVDDLKAQLAALQGL